MAHKFTLNPESLKRRFSVYVVIARGNTNVKLYVGKTGDNREGCNPMISRCGNHFSYNHIHSQVRNKLTDHEERLYTYVFDHFDDYYDDITKRRTAIDRINEMERWLREEVQKVVNDIEHCELLNPFLGTGYVGPEERSKRLQFRTEIAKEKIDGIVEEVIEDLRPTSCCS